MKKFIIVFSIVYDHALVMAEFLFSCDAIELNNGNKRSLSK